MKTKIKLRDFVAEAAPISEQDKKFAKLFAALHEVEQERKSEEAKFRKAAIHMFTEYNKKQEAIRSRGYKIAGQIEDLSNATESDLLEVQEEFIGSYLNPPEDQTPRTAEFALPKALIGLRLALAARGQHGN